MAVGRRSDVRWAPVGWPLGAEGANTHKNVCVSLRPSLVVTRPSTVNDSYHGQMNGLCQSYDPGVHPSQANHSINFVDPETDASDTGGRI